MRAFFIKSQLGVCERGLKKTFSIPGAGISHTTRCEKRPGGRTARSALFQVEQYRTLDKRITVAGCYSLGAHTTAGKSLRLSQEQPMSFPASFACAVSAWRRCSCTRVRENLFPNSNVFSGPFYPRALR